MFLGSSYLDIDGYQPGCTSESSRKLYKIIKCLDQLNLEGRAQKSVYSLFPQMILMCSQALHHWYIPFRKPLYESHLYLDSFVFSKFHKKRGLLEKGSLLFGKCWFSQIIWVLIEEKQVLVLAEKAECQVCQLPPKTKNARMPIRIMIMYADFRFNRNGDLWWSRLTPAEEGALRKWYHVFSAKPSEDTVPQNTCSKVITSILKAEFRKNWGGAPWMPTVPGPKESGYLQRKIFHSWFQSPSQKHKPAIHRGCCFIWVYTLQTFTGFFKFIICKPEHFLDKDWD